MPYQVSEVHRLCSGMVGGVVKIHPKWALEAFKGQVLKEVLNVHLLEVLLKLRVFHFHKEVIVYHST